MTKGNTLPYAKAYACVAWYETSVADRLFAAFDFLPQSFLYGGGVAGGEAVVGDVACHYAAGGYDAAVANGYAGAYDDAAAQPAIVTDCHAMACLYGFASLYVVYGMVGRVYLAVGTYLAAIPDSDAAAVEHGGSVVDECVAADGYHVAVVAVERGCDVGGGGYVGDESL